MDSKTSIELNYRVSGNGYPVVFIHGFLESSEMWSYLNFPKKVNAIYVDLPGHGESPDHDSYELIDVAESIKHELHSMGINEYHVIGHSMGGYVGLELKKIDQNCQKLVLLNSNYWSDSVKKKVDRKRVAEIVKTNKDLFIYEAIPNLFYSPEKFDVAVKKTIEQAKNISPKAIANASISMSIRRDFTATISEWKDDVFIIQGIEDSIVSRERMIELSSQFNLKVIEVPDSGHMSHIECSSFIDRTLDDIA